MSIEEKVIAVRNQIKNACDLAKRPDKDIELVAVTKFAPVSAIVEAVKAGVSCVAENRVSEAQIKFPDLKKQFPHLQTHLIGHLQSNKVKDAIEVCDVIQSVDSVKLAQEIQKQALKKNKMVQILLQFNTGREPQKSGAAPEIAMDIIRDITEHMPNIVIKGLMAMAPLTEDEATIKSAFKELKEIAQMAKQHFPNHPRASFEVLSMGMSGDMAIAISQGSTMVRVGSAIFKDVYEQK